MEIEDIEKAAGEEFEHPFIQIEREGFIKGAKWRINSIWHNPQEKPRNLSKCLIEYVASKFDESFTSFVVASYVSDNVGFTGFVRKKKIKRWAYVDDLLPIK